MPKLKAVSTKYGHNSVKIEFKILPEEYTYGIKAEETIY